RQRRLVLLPYTTLFRSGRTMANAPHPDQPTALDRVKRFWAKAAEPEYRAYTNQTNWMGHPEVQRYINRRCSDDPGRTWLDHFREDRKSTRLNSSHLVIS